jgi:hypothetical protein
MYVFCIKSLELELAACDAWEVQEEEATAGVYQMGVDQGKV